MTPYEILSQTHRQRVHDGETMPILADCPPEQRKLVIIWPQLGDFDSLEYAWWLQRQQAELVRAGVTVRAVGIGDRAAGQKFCDYTGFSPEQLFVDPTARLHRELDLYAGLTYRLPGLSPGQNAWVNLMLMCAGLGSPGTLAEVARGYTGDRRAPQLIGADEVVATNVLPPLKGSFFNLAGGTGFQRPFELATLRLRNMSEVLRHWSTYVPNSAYLTQRGGTFLFDAQGALLYEHRDPGVLGFAADKSHPLAFVTALDAAESAIAAGS